jgi:hypothetical protein
MLRKFNVHPKKGEMFTIECESFEVKGGKFILYNDAHKESNEGFLSFDKVAAIIPERQRTDHVICFCVYLKDKPPIKVFAHAFDIEHEPSVSFSIQEKDMRDIVINEWPITDIYIALSEVIAIAPSDGLLSYRR